MAVQSRNSAAYKTDLTRTQAKDLRTTFFKLFLKVSNITGVAIKTEEYVPTITPIISANINPLIDSPPKRKIDSNTTKVVNEVFNVLLKVLFKAPLTVLVNSQDLLINLNSLILSNTTTVSLSEYPITVNTAAMKA